MFNRYLQIGVVAMSLGLLVALFATTEPGGDMPPASTRSSGTEKTAEIITPGNDPLATAATNAGQARAVFAVQGMTCSGCIAQIKTSLADLDGIGDVTVDLVNGRVEVTYDIEKIKETGLISAAISAAGYPATLKQVLTAKEVGRVNRQKSSTSEHYIARVGDWEVLRADFDTELKNLKIRYEKVYGKDVFSGERGTDLLHGLQSQVAQRLIDEGVQLNEIRRADFKLDPASLKKSFSEFLAQRSLTPDQFKRSLAESGLDYDYFLKKFENSVTINAYVEEKVLPGLSTEQERRQQYADWYNNAQMLAEIVYYDKDIERLVQKNSGSSGCPRSGIGKEAPSTPDCGRNCIRKSSTSEAGCERACRRAGNTVMSGCSGKYKRQ